MTALLVWAACGLAYLLGYVHGRSLGRVARRRRLLRKRLARLVHGRHKDTLVAMRNLPHSWASRN